MPRKTLSLPRALTPFAHRNYRLWATGDLISVTGTWMHVVAQGWLVLSLSHSALAMGLSITLNAAPSLLLGMWGGALVDRVRDRRRLLAVTQGLHAALAGAMALLVLSGHVTVVQIYAIGVLAGCVGVVDGPAYGSFAQELVGREQLGRIIALGSLLNSLGRIIGMSLAGVVIAVAGLPAVFALNAASFVVVIACLRLLDVSALRPLARSPRERAGIRAGLRYVARRRELLLVFALAVVLSSFGRNFQVTMAAMSAGPLGVGSHGYGVLSTVFAVGALLGAVFAARLQRMTLRVLLLAAGATAALQATSSLAPGLISFGTAMLLVAVGAVLIDAALGTHVALSTAEEMRGRVLGVQGMVSAGAGALGGPLLGGLAQASGPRGALAIGGVVALAATTATGALLVHRRLRRHEQLTLPTLLLGGVSGAGQPLAVGVAASAEAATTGSVSPEAPSSHDYAAAA